MDFEFIDYTPTPGEKHLGLAKVKCWGKIVLRFKIVPTKDGSGAFPAAASYKIVENGADRYVPAFILDSNSDKEDLEGLIKSNIKRYTGPAPSALAPAKSSGIAYPAAAPAKVENDDLPF